MEAIASSWRPLLLESFDEHIFCSSWVPFIIASSEGSHPASLFWPSIYQHCLKDRGEAQRLLAAAHSRISSPGSIHFGSNPKGNKGTKNSCQHKSTTNPGGTSPNLSNLQFWNDHLSARHRKSWMATSSLKLTTVRRNPPAGALRNPAEPC